MNVMPRAFLVAMIVLAALVVAPSTARPCLVLAEENSTGPSLDTERVLILYDDKTQMEHFVREVTFANATAAFAFVVPTPTKPELAQVKKQPFDALEENYPFAKRKRDPKGMTWGMDDIPKTRSLDVTVVSEQRIGSFTAFVLAAKDAGALDRWLKENRMGLSPAARPWLAHFVALEFYFAAFRYEAPSSEGSKDQSLKSETVRLSFHTPEPYYPYLEPSVGTAAVKRPRTLRVWMVSQRERLPRARFAEREGSPIRWEPSWEAGATYPSQPAQVKRHLGELGALLASQGQLFVQTFSDSRGSREGWSDVVLPANDMNLDEPTFVKEAAGKLLGDINQPLHWVQPTVKEDPPPAESAEPPPTQVERVPPGGSCACRLGATEPRWSIALVLAAIALIARRANGVRRAADSA